MTEKKNRTLYLECTSGISGDMLVAALLDLGAEEQELFKMLKSIPAEGFRIQISRVKKSGLDVCDFDVILDSEHENHDHDMEYLHGHECCPDAGHAHAHSSAGQVHQQGHTHEHRGLPEILRIIEQAEMSPRAKDTAARIFRILAEAEGRAHGVPAGQVHFHEVGAVDSIVDILSAAVCLDSLGITEVIIPELHEGSGTVRCQHGILPVPVPAVLNIVQKWKIPLHMTEIQGELVTPTGAAVAAAVRTSGRLPERFTVERAGLGAGKRNYARPSILRAMLISSGEPQESRELECDRIWKLETNLDDCRGEVLGFTLDRLMEAGARDVHYTPVYMKKNRPAYQLNVICTEADVERLEHIIFEETTTIGIRRIAMDRTILKREIRTVQTPLGPAKVKCCYFHGIERCFPEYNSITELCREHGKNYEEVYRLIQETCEAAEAPASDDQKI